MGTKNNPGKFDCYANALPNEPMFILLARDMQFARRVRDWSEIRMDMLNCGMISNTDREYLIITEATQCAKDGENWRRNNNGIWRRA